MPYLLNLVVLMGHHACAQCPIRGELAGNDPQQVFIPGAGAHPVAGADEGGAPGSVAGGAGWLVVGDGAAGVAGFVRGVLGACVGVVTAPGPGSWFLPPPLPALPF